MAERSNVASTSTSEADARQLRDLGYESRFERSFTVWQTFALGFTYMAPLVGTLTLFAFAVSTGGPPAIWTLVPTAAGQLLVALIFGEIASQYPISGGLYPWARRLWGRRWAWMTSWLYGWALLITIAAVAYGAGPFVGALLGATVTTNWTIGVALALIAVALALNLMGTAMVARVAKIGFAAEMTGVAIAGLYLLLFERHQSFGSLFDSFAVQGSGTYIGAFLAASLLGSYMFYGFEACGDVAEEVADPGRRIPRSMVLTIVVGFVNTFLAFLGFLMAVPSIPDVISGNDADPINTVLVEAFGTGGSKVVLALICLAFLSSVLSIQAAGSRLLFAYGRDRMIFGSGALSKFSPRLGLPVQALVVSAVVPAAIVLVSKVSTDALTKIISFATLGIYISFQMVVLAALRARLRGWKPAGRFQLGAWAMAINVIALVYGVAVSINLAWPRTPDAAWYDNYIVLISAAVVIGVGLAYLLIARPHDRSDAPHSDAHLPADLAAPPAMAGVGYTPEERAGASLAPGG